MSDLEIVDLGASRLDENSGVVLAVAKGAPISEDEAPGYGDAPLMAALGVAARPAPATEGGSAQGVAAQVAGHDGAIIAGHDPRCAKVYGEIGAGETAVFATGEAFDARALFKDRVVALIVGDDMVLTLDGRDGQKKIALSCPGGVFQVAEDSGITACDASGRGSLRIQGGTSALLGQVILGGGRPKGPVADAQKVEAELAKISVCLKAVTPPQTYIPSPVGAAGLFVGS